MCVFHMLPSHAKRLIFAFFPFFSISDKADLSQLKEQLKNALASVNAIASGLILGAVDRFHNSLIKLGDYIRPLLTAAGKEDGKAFL